MRHFALLLGIIFPNVIVADQLTINVPSAVANTIREYRAECTDEGGALELDGDCCKMSGIIFIRRHVQTITILAAYYQKQPSFLN